MIYIGVDPGLDGGIGIIDTIENTAEAIPYTDDAFIDALHRIARTKVMVEQVGAMPKQSPKSMFNFGTSYGKILGILKAYRIPYDLVRPQAWKKEFHCTADKSTSIEACKRLFPNVNLLKNERCRKPHDGMAESLLIAEYARRTMM